jgi:hypothetical protein
MEKEGIIRGRERFSFENPLPKTAFCNLPSLTMCIFPVDYMRIIDGLEHE